MPKTTEPKCNAVIRRCAEAGHHQPPCTCIMDPGHEGPHVSELPKVPGVSDVESALLERPRQRAYVVARDYQDGVNWIRCDSGLLTNPRNILVVSTEQAVRGINRNAIIFATGRAYENPKYGRIMQALQIMGAV